MTKDELRRRVDLYEWFHIMDLGQGVITPGVIDPVGKEHAPRFHVPARLDGTSVLDIGAWDGAWSFEAKRRGAKRVLATDSYSWGGGGWGHKGAFELAREALGLDVDDKFIDVLDLSRATVGTFDVVFFFGVIYHMRNPMAALDRLREVTAPGGLAIVESLSAMNKRKEPLLAFYPSTECGGDPTNWFAPNPPALAHMLKACGFQHVELVSKPDKWSRMTLHAR
ncbi:MAG: tRNA 5-methoxyuridine(34)/uridine 5-oxyacetic acid(34) synthase CmoB [Candidatus Eremiobacteraeota bacterium]|nr:tRNA 5-methoxyuridine(34)/uridine 5-oxyacetic acid(34) synthase CmoB [Candidatus Eremiobacteraeota bacterium]